MSNSTALELIAVQIQEVEQRLLLPIEREEHGRLLHKTLKLVYDNTPDEIEAGYREEAFYYMEIVLAMCRKYFEFYGLEMPTA